MGALPDGEVAEGLGQAASRVSSMPDSRKVLSNFRRAASITVIGFHLGFVVGLVVVVVVRRLGVTTAAKSRAGPWKKAAAPASPVVSGSGSVSVPAMRMPLMVR
ncbi:hypothetical protein [Streptomyces sp. NPDC059071]|uniref:hypothetical protein n=1 Tax=unclassified Streptomyces TaxID=2593676 RepID=UPI003665DDCD